MEEEVEIQEEDILHEGSAEEFDLDETTVVTAYVTMYELVFGEEK